MPPRSPVGFRFSWTDAVFLAVSAVGTWLLRATPFVVLVPFVVVHFFLFCNVFRVRRKWELTWAACFLVNFAAWALTRFSWTGVFAVQVPITLAVIAITVRSPGYRGVGTRLRAEELER